MQVHRGLFRARDDTSLYYEVRGKGPPLLFAYGLTCKMAHWRHQLDYFAGRYQVITVDYRGHHRSSRPPNRRNYSIEWCARDLQDTLRYLNVGRPVCLGHSMGVPVLVKLAEIEPDLEALVFICGTVDNPFQHMFHSNRLDRFYQRYSQLYELAPELMSWVWHHFTKRNRLNAYLMHRLGFNASLSALEDVHSYMDGVHDSPLETFQKLLYDYSNFDGHQLLDKITCPTLVIAGEADRITPVSLSNAMAKRISKAELVRIPEGSHNAHMDLPGIVNRRIEDFLTKVI